MLQTQLKEIEQILHAPKPSLDDFQYFKNLLGTVFKQLDYDELKELVVGVRDSCPAINSLDTIQGSSIIKPYGYSGDFEIIDKIYTMHMAEHEPYKSWDKLFHTSKAAIAVRNRKEYFKQILRKLYKLDRDIMVLNLASGPCRDIAEHYQEFPDSKIWFECIDMDPNAILYAERLLGENVSRVNFIQKNVFRVTPEKKYDLVWSAGLFDYFDDKAFVKVLKRFIDFDPTTKIIVGNFCDTNPSRAYMELMGDWYLHHRSRKNLFELTDQIGVSRENVTIDSEPEEVNLFLHIN